MNVFYIIGFLLLTYAVITKQSKGHCVKIFRGGKWELHGECGSEAQSQILKDLDLKLAKRTGPEKCSKGFVYGGLCYWSRILDRPAVTFAQAETQCKKDNGVSAFPVNEEHYMAMLAHIRKKAGRDNVLIALGLRYDAATKKTTTLNGNAAPYLKWNYVYQIKSYTYVQMIVRSNPNESEQGMQNEPSSSAVDGVICQPKSS